MTQIAIQSSNSAGFPSVDFQKTARLIAAPFTPFCSDGSLNLSLIEKYAEKLCNDGVSGVFACGTTGEGMSLTQSERKSVVEVWGSVVKGRMRLVVHVGHTSVEEARDLARHAEKIGADGISTMAPIFFSPENSRALVKTCGKIADAAKNTPFYYYHLPSMSRAQFPVSSFFVEMVKSIPTFRGVKFTHEDMKDYRQCVELAENKYEIFFGRDELFLEGLKAGAHSAVGSTYNFAAPLYRSVSQAYQAGDQAGAERLQSLCTKAIESMIRLGGLPAIKAVMSFVGMNCGPVRLPLQTIDQSRLSVLEKELREMGFLDAIKK